jgi:hypothetical protein
MARLLLLGRNGSGEEHAEMRATSAIDLLRSDHHLSGELPKHP